MTADLKEQWQLQNRRLWSIQNYVINQASPDEVAVSVQNAVEQEHWTISQVEELAEMLADTIDVLNDERRDVERGEREYQETMKP